MKTNKIAIILSLFLLPVLLNAQENKTQEKVNKGGTQIITITVSDANLDSAALEGLKETLEKEVEKQIQEMNNKNSDTSNITSDKTDSTNVKRANGDPTPIPSPFQKKEKNECVSSNLEYIGNLENGKSVKVSYRNIAAKHVPKLEFSHSDTVENPDPNVYKNIVHDEVINFDTDESYPTTYAWVTVAHKYADYWIYLYERESDDSDASSLPYNITVTIYKGNVMKKLAEEYSTPFNKSGWYKTNKEEEFFTFFGGCSSEYRLHAATVKNGNTIIVSAKEKKEDFDNNDEKLIKHMVQLINFNVTEQNKYFIEKECGNSGLYEFRKNTLMVDHGGIVDGYK